MDPRLLQFYIQELAHVRDSGAEFASRFPKVASRLAMDSTEVQDPYVERLLEGFAFLAARVQLRLHDEFPRFTEQLLNRISPNFLAPIPSMGVVQLKPNPGDAALKNGIAVPAGTLLQSQVAKGIHTPCKFRTGHPLTLWPLEIESVSHGPFPGSPPRIPAKGVVRSALHVRIRNTMQSPVLQLPVDSLDFHVHCGDEYAFALLDRVNHSAVGVAIRGEGQANWKLMPAGVLQPLGLDSTEALLPTDTGQFSGMRLLQEFFAFPQRFLFFQVRGLRAFLSTCAQPAFELAICFADSHAEMDRIVDMQSLALHCTPVINLFEHACDRVVLDERQHEMQVQPNRSKPHDYEIHSLIDVEGHGQQRAVEVPPLYSSQPGRATTVGEPHEGPCYVLTRSPTLLSERQRREGARSSYIGSEVYLGLTLSTGELLSRHGLHQLGLRALCTNRDLALLMPLGQGASDLHWPGNLPLQSIRFVRGPSRPRQARKDGQVCWQLIEHLSLNYLGLLDSGESAATPSLQGEGARAITQLLVLHADPSQAAQKQWAQAVQRVHSEVAVARILRQGRPAVVRGLRVILTLDEQALQGVGMGALGSVLAQYLASHVSVNSFVQTRICGLHSGTVFDFPARSGDRPLL